MAIWRVNAVRSQNPLPKESTTALGEAPMASAAMATSTTPARAKMYASGNHFCVQPASVSAIRAKPFWRTSGWSVCVVVMRVISPLSAVDQGQAWARAGVGPSGGDEAGSLPDRALLDVLDPFRGLHQPLDK